MSDKVECRTPNPDRPGTTNLPAWKFDVCRKAVLAVLSDGDVRAADLSQRAGATMDAETLETLGKLGWHIITVRLELEVRGEVERLPGRPLLLRATP